MMQRYMVVWKCEDGRHGALFGWDMNRREAEATAKHHRDQKRGIEPSLHYFVVPSRFKRVSR